jgi:hypothetical protein
MEGGKNDQGLARCRGHGKRNGQGSLLKCDCLFYLKLLRKTIFASTYLDSLEKRRNKKSLIYVLGSGLSILPFPF